MTNRQGTLDALCRIPTAAPTPEPMQADLRETIARIEEIATWLESGDPGAEGSVLFSASVAQEHATDLKAILAAVQAESEPVAWRGRDLDAFGDGAWAVCTFKPSCDEVEPLYTHPSPSAPNPDLAGLVEGLQELLVMHEGTAKNLWASYHAKRKGPAAWMCKQEDQRAETLRQAILHLASLK